MSANTRRLPHRDVERAHMSQYAHTRVRFVTTVGQSEASSQNARARAGGAVPMRRTTATAIAAVALVLVAGCTEGGQEPAGLSTVTSTPPATPDPTPTPTPTGPVDRSDEAAGIVFTDLPDLTGDALSAFDTLTLYEYMVQQSTTSGVLDPGLQLIAAPDLIDVTSYQIEQNLENGWTVGGIVIATVTIVDADPYTAHATVCHDFTQSTYTQGGVTHDTADVGLEPTTLYNVVLSRFEESTPWAVDSYERAGTC